MSSEGVIYYNHGERALLKLSISLHSLRKVYLGPVTILAHGPGLDKCYEIAKMFQVNIIESKLPITGHKFVYLNKCLYHTETPYDVTIAIDNDTIVLKSEFTNLFTLAKEYEFVLSQFATWGTDHGQIKSRILSWKKYYPRMIDKALEFGKGINCGIIAFRKDSKLMQDWYKLASVGRTCSFIPDETCCQVILPNYPHYIADTSYNTSCKYGVVNNDTKIIHYHGRKHCRIENNQYVNHSDVWYKNFEKIRHIPLIQSLIPLDKYLRDPLIVHDSLKIHPVEETVS